MWIATLPPWRSWGFYTYSRFLTLILHRLWAEYLRTAESGKWTPRLNLFWARSCFFCVVKNHSEALKTYLHSKSFAVNGGLVDLSMHMKTRGAESSFLKWSFTSLQECVCLRVCVHVQVQVLIDLRLHTVRQQIPYGINQKDVILKLCVCVHKISPCEWYHCLKGLRKYIVVSCLCMWAGQTRTLWPEVKSTIAVQSDDSCIPATVQ